MIVRGVRTPLASLTRLGRRFCVPPGTQIPDVHSETPNLTDEERSEIAMKRFNSQRERGDHIEFREVKILSLFKKNIGATKEFKDSHITIVSVPSTRNILKNPNDYREILDRITGLGRPVALPLDPTRYIHNSRKIGKVFDEKLYSSEHPIHKQDPIWMTDTREVNINVNVMNHYYKAFLQTQKDSQPAEKKAVSLEDLERESADDQHNKDLPDDVYTQHLKQLAEQGDSAGNQQIQKNMEGCFESLFLGPGSYPVQGDLVGITSGLAFGFVRGSFSWQPTQLLYRIMLASYMDTQALMSQMLEFGEDYMNRANPGTPGGLPFEEFIKQQAYAKFSYHNALYGIAFLEQFVFENGVAPVVLADSIAAAHLETLLTENYDHTLRYHEFKDLRAIYDIEIQSEIVKRHALLDVLFEQKLWGEPFVSNEFAYINTNKSRIADADIKRLQKQYFLAYKKLSAAKSKLKMEAGGSAFDMSPAKTTTKRTGSRAPDKMDLQDLLGPG